MAAVLSAFSIKLKYSELWSLSRSWAAAVATASTILAAEHRAEPEVDRLGGPARHGRIRREDHHEEGAFMARACTCGVVRPGEAFALPALELGFDDGSKRGGVIRDEDHSTVGVVLGWHRLAER